MEWQTIETAPKHETIILYGGAFFETPMIGYWLRVDGDERLWEGFAEASTGYIPDSQPTLWMPLPKPPCEQETPLAPDEQTSAP